MKSLQAPGDLLKSLFGRRENRGKEPQIPLGIGRSALDQRLAASDPAINGILKAQFYCRASQPAICPSGNRTTSESLKCTCGFQWPVRWTTVVLPGLITTGSTAVAA